MSDGGDIPARERIREDAKAVIRAARRIRMEIWYDRGGVAWLDAHIERIRKGSRGDLGGLVASFGAFLGECVIRTHGGDWAEREGAWGVRFDEKNWAFPFAKAAKQIENGREDSVLAFFDAIPRIFRRPPPTPEGEDPDGRS